VSLTRRQWIVWGTGLFVLMLCVLWAIDVWVTGPRRALMARIDSVQAAVDRRRSDLDLDHKVQSQLDAFSDRTLGGTQEEVDHALRAALSALATNCGLEEGLSVDTDTAKPVASPGRRDFKGSAARALRDEPDFVELPATVRARGTWRQISDLVVGLSSQPWLHHVEGVRLVGKKEGDDVEATMRVRAVFIPGRAPSEPMTLAAADPAIRLAAESPFMLPAPPPPPRVAGGAASAPAPPGWERWRVTFVGRIEAEDEVHLRAGHGGVRRLRPGDTLEGCEFLGNRPDEDGFDLAMFRREGATWLVAPGATFRDRQAVSE